MVIGVITQDQIKAEFNYNPLTGSFKRRSTGREAGCHNTKGYRVVKFKSVQYKVHRLIYLYMTGSWPEGYIDHFNGVKDDNRWANIKDVSHLENCKNMKRLDRNTSGVTGVSWDKSCSKWVSVISDNNKRIYLGSFSDKGEAVKARKLAEKLYNYNPNHGR